MITKPILITNINKPNKKYEELLTLLQCGDDKKAFSCLLQYFFDNKIIGKEVISKLEKDFLNLEVKYHPSLKQKLYSLETFASSYVLDVFIYSEMERIEGEMITYF